MTRGYHTICNGPPQTVPILSLKKGLKISLFRVGYCEMLPRACFIIIKCSCVAAGTNSLSPEGGGEGQIISEAGFPVVR